MEQGRGKKYRGGGEERSIEEGKRRVVWRRVIWRRGRGE